MVWWGEGVTYPLRNCSLGGGDDDNNDTKPYPYLLLKMQKRCRSETDFTLIAYLKKVKRYRFDKGINIK
jgi:hypothetical protein